MERDAALVFRCVNAIIDEIARLQGELDDWGIPHRQANDWEAYYEICKMERGKGGTHG